MDGVNLMLDTAILCNIVSEGLIVLNPLTQKNECIYYPLTYETISSHLMTLKQQSDDEMIQYEEMVSKMQKENDRLMQRCKNLQRQNSILYREFSKSIPKTIESPREIQMGTVIFPKGFEVDESLDQIKVYFFYNFFF